MPGDWRKVALECAGAADDKKAADIVVLDIRGISTVADYFVICEGTSDRHIKAIAGEIKSRLKRADHPCIHIDGYGEGRWVILDFAGVMAHVFSRELRDYYRLEALWGDAGRVDIETGDTKEQLDERTTER